MNASDVYNVAKALPKVELNKLYAMLKEDVKPQNHFKRTQKQKKLPDFTVDDGIRYLIKNLMK